MRNEYIERTTLICALCVCSLHIAYRINTFSCYSRLRCHCVKQAAASDRFERWTCVQWRFKCVSRADQSHYHVSLCLCLCLCSRIKCYSYATHMNWYYHYTNTTLNNSNSNSNNNADNNNWHHTRQRSEDRAKPTKSKIVCVFVHVDEMIHMPRLSLVWTFFVYNSRS